MIRRDVTSASATVNGCTVRRWYEHGHVRGRLGAFLFADVFSPHGIRVGRYKTERGIAAAASRHGFR